MRGTTRIDRNEKAIVLLRKALALDPDNPMIHERLAVLYLQTGQRESAAERLRYLSDLYLREENTVLGQKSLERLIGLEPENTSALEDLADMYSRKGLEADRLATLERLLEVYVGNSNLSKACVICEDILKMDPSRGDIRQKLIEIQESFGSRKEAISERKKLAKNLHDEKNYRAALEQYEDILRVDPNDLEAQEACIELLSQLGRVEEAANGAFNIAQMMEREDDLPSAIAWYRKAAEIEPNSSKTWEKLGQALENMDEATDEAVSAYLKAAELLIVDKAEQAAQEVLKRILNISPKNTKAHELQIRILRVQNKVRESVEKMTALAEILLSEGNTEGATHIYEEALSESPDSLAIAFQLGQIYLAAEREEDFCHLYERLATRKLAQGNTTEAVDLLKHILSVKPTRTDVRQLLADSYQALEEPVLAAKELSLIAEEIEKDFRICDEKDVRDNLIVRARRAHEQAIECLPRSVGLHLAFVEFEGELGDSTHLTGIVEDFVESSLDLIRSDELQEEKPSLKDLQDLIETGKNFLPDSPILLETEARVLNAFGEKESAGGVLLKAGDLRQQSENLHKAYEDFHLAHTYLPDHDEPLVRIMAVSRAQGNIDRTLSTAWELAGRYRASGSLKELQTILDTIGELDTENTRIDEWRIDIALGSGRTEEAVTAALRAVDALLARDKTAESLDLCRETREKIPGSAQLSERIILCLERLEDIQGAVREGMALAQSYTDEEADKALALYEHLIELAPGNTTARRSLAELLERQGKVSEALAQWLSLSPLYVQTGLSEKAIELLRGVRDKYPEEPTIRYRLLDLLEKENMHHSAAQEGLSLLSLLISAERKDLRECRSLAERVLRNKPDLEEAVEIYADVLFELGEEDLFAEKKIQQARLLREQDNFQGAIACLTQAAQQLPQNVTLLNALEEVREQSLRFEKRSSVTQRLENANKLLFSGKGEEALAALESLRGEEPDNLEVAQSLARAYGKAGKRERMFATYLDIADAYRDKKATGQAMKALSSITEVDPTFVPALERIADLEQETAPDRAADTHLTLGGITFKKGEFEQSAEHLRKALALRPSNPTALEMLGDALWKPVEEGMAEGSLSSIGAAHQALESLAHLQNAVSILQAKEMSSEGAGILERILSRANRIASATKDKSGPEWDSLREEVWTKETESRKNLVAFLMSHSRADEAVDIEIASAQRLIEEERADSAKEILLRLLNVTSESIPVREMLLNLLLNEYSRIRSKDSDQITFTDSMVVMHTPSPQEQSLAEEIIRQRVSLGQLYENSGESDLAIAQYEETLKMSSSHVEARERLIDLYFGKGDVQEGVAQLTVLANAYREKELWGKVLELYQKAMEIVPENRALILEVGKVYAHQGLQSKAVRLLRHTGDLDWGKEDYRGAIECYQEALKVEPNNVTLLAKTARGLLELDSSDRAREAYNTLMEVYSERGLFTRAEQIFEKDMVDFPQHEELWRFLAKQWQRKHHSELAVQLLECLKKLRPKANVDKQLELLYGSEKIDAVKKSPALGSNLGRGFKTAYRSEDLSGEPARRGQTQKELLAQIQTNYERRRYSIALTQLQSILQKSKRELSPDDLVDIYNLAGMCHLQLKEFDKAIESFSEGSKVPEANPRLLKEVRYNLAQAYEQNSQIDQAVDLWKDIYSIDPNFRDIKTKILAMHLRRKK